ncbi:MAG: NAD(P)/FAD-dependent oxidoreductase, partial [Betaproteobacteria bacterium]|nr:NAD(P)/FAD-dependent oxidoreductase [Betaproteobacteria bacterium]
APYRDEDGVIVTEARSFPYDTLVLAVGSLTNDFGTPGVVQNAIALEDSEEADRFHRRLVNAFLRAHAQSAPLRPEQLQVAIVGAGATGVELAAELHNATRDLVSYNLDRIDPDKPVKLHLIEASSRILPALPERISNGAQRMLTQLQVEVHTNARVAEVLPQVVRLATGQMIPAELVVWAAGVKAPEFLVHLGLETNGINQVVVQPTLQSTRDDRIFAIGDCAAAPWLGHEGKWVPPRAQAAHQQSSHLVRELARRLEGKPMRPFHYRDFGSLVSLGEYTTVGNLMGNFVGGNMWVEGLFARWMYVSLYKLHQMALHGFWKMALNTLARFISRRTEPHVKLH